MNYPCEGKEESWTGEITLIAHSGSSYEVEIEGRGSGFNVITGRHINGNYVCLPGVGVGSELGGYQDVGWNTERLSRYLPEPDAVTVASGLSHLRELI